MVRIFLGNSVSWENYLHLLNMDSTQQLKSMMVKTNISELQILVYYAGFLIRARIMSEYNAEFVFQNTLTYEYEKFIKVTSMRSGQPGVNAQEYSKYQIMVPSKPEQDKISDCFRSLDNLITLHQRKFFIYKSDTNLHFN